MKNKVFNLIIIIVSAIIFISFFLVNKGLGSMIDELKTLNMLWLPLALFLIFLFWLFETLVIYVITKKFHKTNNLLKKSFQFEMIGQYFGALTPFAAGSHPAQLYSMTENEIPAGVAGSILMLKFMLHQITNIVILLLAFFFKFNYFYSRVPYFLYFFAAGLVVHIIIMICMILFSINENLIKNILFFSFKILKKLHLIKDIEASQKKVEEELKDFHKNISLITKNIKLCISASLLTLLQWFAFFSIPFCIYKSFNFDSHDIFSIIAAQIFLINFMAIIPLPGAEGGAEGGFYLINSLFFKGSTIITAIFIWRVLTYYFSIAIGGIFTLLIPKVTTKHQKA